MGRARGAGAGLSSRGARAELSSSMGAVVSLWASARARGLATRDAALTRTPTSGGLGRQAPGSTGGEMNGYLEGKDLR
jgi:hypothetical protein